MYTQMSRTRHKNHQQPGYDVIDMSAVMIAIASPMANDPTKMPMNCPNDLKNAAA